ncbi:unnamed protein product, partial [Chrysoparadoxa australica]
MKAIKKKPNRFQRAQVAGSTATSSPKDTRASATSVPDATAEPQAAPHDPLLENYLTATRDKARAHKKQRQSLSLFDEESDDDLTEPIASKGGGDEEVDPLEAFMVGVQETVKQEATNVVRKPKPEVMEQEDDLDDYAKEREKAAETAAVACSEKPEGSVDSEGYPTGRVPEEKKHITPLPLLDHSTIEYEPFRKDLYVMPPEQAVLAPNEVEARRRNLEIRVDGAGGAVPPVQSFMHAGLGDTLLTALIKRGFESPTPIQAQSIPVVLSGRDVIGVAKTGSGKTLAYLLPALVHVMDQREMKKGEGPIVCVLCPTRELATQIYSEAKKFAKVLGAKACAVFGGGGKWEMQKALKEGPEIVVATPGRMMEMIKSHSTNMGRCTMMILDEADRMFDMGFEYQMRSIVQQVRPDRQTLLFSATLKRKVEHLCNDILTDPIAIHVGTGQLTSNEDVHQVVTVLHNDSEKWSWLLSHLQEFLSRGKVLVFVGSKQGCDNLSKSLGQHLGATVAIGHIHGDRDQVQREETLRAYKHGKVQLLIATDVAARGLDIKEVNTVCNYDVARNIESHIHRIGRTGRMTKDGAHPGTAHTLITHSQSHFAVDLVRNLEVARQPVPPKLRELAGRANRRRGGG